MSKAVIIEYPRDIPATPDQPGRVKGETYSVPSAAEARKWHPDAKIVTYEDGTPYEEPAPKPSRTSTKKAKAAKQPAAPATPVEPPIEPVAE